LQLEDTPCSNLNGVWTPRHTQDLVGPEGLKPQYFGPVAYPATSPPPIMLLSPIALECVSLRHRNKKTERVAGAFSLWTPYSAGKIHTLVTGTWATWIYSASWRL